MDKTATDVGNDGAGGGGAGGSVLLNVNTWNIASSKTLTISANAGSGGNVTDAAAHGGGGGGGQGAIIFSTATPSTNITVRTLNGQGGRNYSGGTFADNGAGADNVGIYNSSFALLPLKMISFQAKKSANVNMLDWHMSDDEEIIYYDIQRSYDGNNFETIATVQHSIREYSYPDNTAENKNVYYRIVMHDNDGHIQYSSVLMLKVLNSSVLSVALMPNPVRDHATLKIESGKAVTATVRIINSLGMVVSAKNVNLNKGENSVSIADIIQLSRGAYEVIVNAADNSANIKMLVNR